MRCETCLLTRPEAATLALQALVERLERCEGCPHLEGPARGLLGRLRESASALRRATNQARKAELERAELEREAARYEARISKLEEAQKAAVREADADLRAQAELLQRREAELLEVWAPILAVWEGLVVAPVIGHVDAARAGRLLEGILSAVRASGARQVIVDLTGVHAVDVEIADHLSRIARSVRLLGGEVVLTGLRPAIAATLVGIGADLTALRTMHSLREALRAFLAAPRAGGVGPR